VWLANYSTSKIISCSINYQIELELAVALNFEFAGLNQLKINGMKELIYMTSKSATIWVCGI